MRKVDVVKCTALLCVAAPFCSALLMAQAGSLDPTFGNNGIVITPNTGTATAMALESNGEIVVAGSVIDSQGFPELGLARYTANGNLDSSFGTGGIVSNADAPAFAVAIQPDGKILVGSITGFDLAVLRYNTNGTLDNTFGTAGVASVSPFGELFFSPVAGGLAVLSDGKIVVAGSGGFGGGFMTRLLANGQVDTSFGVNGAGAVILVAAPQGLAVLPGGKILVSTEFSAVLAARYTSTGALDTSFGVNGQIPTLGADAIVPLSNGDFVAAGTIITVPQPPPAVNSTQGFAVEEYNSEGVVLGSFGTHGGVATNFPGNTYSAALAVAVQSNGEIIAGGETALNNPVFVGDQPLNFALARYTATGQLDTTFGTNGLVTTAVGNALTFVDALAIQSDGKILALGTNTPDEFGFPDPGFTLARYLSQ
jgi:uncharacterized delta-60 repeat protein